MIGLRIKQLREEQNISQRQLAKVLGIQNSTLSQYESGTRTPSDDIKKAIASYFNVSLDYLIAGQDEIRPLTLERLKSECIKAGINPNDIDNLNTEQIQLAVGMFKQMLKNNK